MVWIEYCSIRLVRQSFVKHGQSIEFNRIDMRKRKEMKIAQSAISYTDKVSIKKDFMTFTCWSCKASLFI